MTSIRFEHNGKLYESVRHSSSSGMVYIIIETVREQDKETRSVSIDSSSSPAHIDQAFKTVSTPMWINLTIHDRRHYISASDLKIQDYFIEKGVDPALALRIAMKVNEKPSGFSLEETFNPFFDSGHEVIFDIGSNWESNLEYYFQLCSVANPKIALKSLNDCNGDLYKMWSTHNSLWNMQLHPSILSFLEDLDKSQFEEFLKFDDFADMSDVNQAIASVRIISKMSSEDMRRARKFRTKMFIKKSIQELLDDRDSHVNDPAAMCSELTDQIKSLGVFAYHEFDEIMSLLIARYSLSLIQKVIETMINNRLESVQNNISTFVYVADYIEESGIYDTPIDWILKMSDASYLIETVDEEVEVFEDF